MTPHDDLAAALDELGCIASASTRALPASRMRDLLVRVLVDLDAALAVHFEREEAGGYAADVLGTDPTLARTSEAVREHHRALAGRVAALRDAAGREVVTTLQREVSTLVQAIRVHDHGDLGRCETARSSSPSPRKGCV